MASIIYYFNTQIFSCWKKKPKYSKRRGFSKQKIKIIILPFIIYQISKNCHYSKKIMSPSSTVPPFLRSFTPLPAPTTTSARCSLLLFILSIFSRAQPCAAGLQQRSSPCPSPWKLESYVRLPHNDGSSLISRSASPWTPSDKLNWNLKWLNRICCGSMGWDRN